MNAKQEQAKQDYLNGMKYKDIATKYGVSISTVKSWKARYWKDDKDATALKKVATKNEKVATKKAVEQLDNSDLTEKQKLFCLYYLQRFNATWAYQKAYGVDYETAHKLASRMMANDGIKKEISNLKMQQENDLYLNANDILKEYVKQAFTSLDDVLNYKSVEVPMIDQEGEVAVDVKGNPMTKHLTDIYLKPSDEIDWSVIQDIHIGRDGLVVKTYDKQKAMKELLDRLPEPENTHVESDTFLQAIEQGIHKLKKDGEETWHN